ncbi:hypothetical protein ACF8C6_05065 [Pseudomonas sp. zbq_18]|uniref:hypothetical protein n=1 Tax=Pseudomonas sp. zbq_18 TaxID=3367251 RepID=UPI00370B194A
MKQSLLKAAGLALLVSSASPMATACGYDNPLADFAPAHPESLGVALAIYDAYESKQLRRPAPLPGGFGMRRALNIIDKLEASLGPDSGSGGFYLLMVESGLWTSYQTVDGTWVATAHVAEPAVGEPVVITGEGVLIALQGGKLNFNQAMESGLLRVEASTLESTGIKQSWQQAAFSVAQAN